MTKKESLSVQLKAFIASSVAMFVSLPIGSAKLTGIMLALWVGILGWTIFSNFKKSNFDLSEAVEKKEKEMKTKKDILSFSLVKALVIIGILVILLDIFRLLFVI